MEAASVRAINPARERAAKPVITTAGFRPWIFRIGAASMCLASALALTAQRIEITRLSYKINDLHQHRQTLQSEVAALETEAQMLGSSSRIRKKAEELGLVFPDPSSIVNLDE